LGQTTSSKIVRAKIEPEVFKLFDFLYLAGNAYNFGVFGQNDPENVNL